MNRSVVFIRIPVFPVAVERAISRKLLNRPIILSQNDSPRVRCLAVSSEAYHYGIRAGMRLSDARRRCRELTVLLPNPSLYQRAGRAIKSIMDEFSPLVEPARPGQNYIDMTGSKRLFGGTLSAAERIKDSIIEKLRLPVDAGIATNKLVSRVAALDANPMRLIEVEWGNEEPFLAPHRVDVLPAVDRPIRSQLIELNIRHVEQVKETESDLLAGAIGPAALPIMRQARGIDPEPVILPTTPPQVFLCEELSEDSNDQNQIAAYLQRLLVEGIFRLNRSGNAVRTIVLTLEYSDGITATNVKRLRAGTDSGSILVDSTRTLLNRTMTRRIRVRRITLILKELSRAVMQLRLWNTAIIPEENCLGYWNDSEDGDMRNPQTCRSNYRFDRVLKAFDKINDRYGDSALKLGAVT